MEQHASNWGYVIAGANSILALVFLWFGISLARAARRSPKPARANRFRRALGRMFLGLGVFFTWIMLAWATVISFSEPVQAALLTLCAGLGMLALRAWRATTPERERTP